MAYEKHDWVPGEIITEELLDHMEQGIADASGGTGEIADGSVTKAKLAEDVQASLGKADTALQAAPTKVPEGALVPGAGIDLTRGEDDTLTCAVKAKGVTAAMIADGVIPAAYTLPAATDKAIGGVKRAAAVAAVGSADAAASAAAPTKEEFDKVVAVANETKRQLNALIAAGQAAGFFG